MKIDDKFLIMTKNQHSFNVVCNQISIIVYLFQITILISLLINIYFTLHGKKRKETGSKN